MENKNDLSHKESLGLIEQMISAARNEHREKGDGWLIWGWLLFIASITSAVFMKTNFRDYIGWVWTGMLVAGVLITVYLTATQKKQNEVVTYVQGLLKKFGAGFFISLFIMIAAANINVYANNYSHASSFGYYYILYAFWMFIHGSAIRFRPLIVGAIANWAAAIAIFLLPDFFYTMVISAIAILAGYLIPGYMLRNQYNRSYHPNRENL